MKILNAFAFLLLVSTTRARPRNQLRIQEGKVPWICMYISIFAMLAQHFQCLHALIIFIILNFSTFLVPFVCNDQTNAIKDQYVVILKENKNGKLNLINDVM